MKLSPSGTSISTAKPRKNATPPKRTANRGWTKHAAIRNRQFLFSVVPQQLSGFGFAITHTVTDCESPQIWAEWVNRYFKYIGRKWPLTRWHCVTEWQRRGVPHLHATIYIHGHGDGSHGSRPAGLGDGGGPRMLMPGTDLPNAHQLTKIWLHIAKAGSPSSLGQDVKPISLDDSGHWLQYLAKHGARGVSNYQRHADNVPTSWKGKTGRVWRKGGDWPTESRVEVHGLSKSEEYQVRRIFCRYLASVPPSQRVKKCQRASVRRYWKSFLSCNDFKRSRFRAPTSFIDIEDQVRLIKCVNPDAYFTDEGTGEIFHSVEDMPVDRSPHWTPPPVYEHTTDMADIL